MKKAALLLLALAYPFAVFFALGRGFSPKALSILLILAALLQFNAQKVKALRNAFVGCAALLVAGLWYFGSEVFLQLYPVLVSLSVLAVFAFSIKCPPTVPEMFARLRHRDLPPQAVAYCRKVALLWCCFLAVNAAVALCTVFLSREAWTLYNGLISYLLMGLLMAGEYCYRLRRMKSLQLAEADGGGQKA
jgi:uncharacterized membrane protein